MKRFLPILLFMIVSEAMPSFGQGDSVIREGKEWLQPVYFTNLSWNEIDAVCPGGLCNGQLNGVDVTGFRWASVDDMNALFNSYGVSPPIGPGPDFRVELSSVWAPLYFEDFHTTETSPSDFGNLGWTRSEVPNKPSDAYFAEIQYSTAPDQLDAVSSGGSGVPKTEEGGNVGAYFWRPATTPSATAIPTMSVYGLAITMLGLLLVAARYFQIRSTNEG